MSEVTGNVGQLLGGRYRLVSLLGQGGMGCVWRAEHTSLGTPVAIKLIHPELAQGQGLLARFQREAKAAAKLRGAHVVQILDHGVDDGVPYIAMECLEGESLAQRLAAERTLSPAATAQVISGVCAALVGAHRLGIVHRDLKPDNVFLAREETATVVKVLDFGVAKLLDAGAADPNAPTEATTNRTETGAMLGTPRYMSPEQARGRAELDGRSDLWSLAVITFECLTGKRPFDAGTMGDLILQICTEPIPAPSSIGPVPAGFDAWFARATERGPAARFQTARAFAETLAEILTPGAPWLDAEREISAGGASDSDARGPERASGPSTSPATPTDGSASATLGGPTASAKPSIAKRVAWGLVAVAALVGALVAGRAALAPEASPAASAKPFAASALAPPRTVLACPILEAEGVFAPSGWLGAAVAQHVCKRATWLLEGLPERTRIPAELLALASAPSVDAPLDPFGAPGARERTLEVAKQRAAAYVDGRVERTSAGFEVSLRIVESASGVASATFPGRGANPFAAADEALDGLRRAGLLEAQPLDPEIVRIYDVRTAEAGWIIDDDVPATDEEVVCARAARRASELGTYLAVLGRCKGKGGLTVEPMPIDPRTVGTLAWTAFGAEGNKERSERARPLLEEKLAAEKHPAGRALLIQALVVVRSTLGDKPEALEELMMEAARISPRGVAWNLVMAFSTATNRVALGRAAHAWDAPEPYPAWLTFGLSDAASLPFLRRDWELKGFASTALTTYAKVALLTGRREEASALAGACQAGPAAFRPVGEAISARMDIESGRFGAGQRRLLEALLAIDAYSQADYRAFTPLHTNILLAYVLGNAPTVADPIVRAYVLADPPRATFNQGDPYAVFPIVAHCMNASPKVAEPCFERFDAWKKEGKLPPSDLLDAYIAGGRAFAKGDVGAALKVWRPVLQATGGTTMLPFDALLKADPSLPFDIFAGESVMQLVGVPLTTARDAKRAARKGDKAKARELAQLVIDKWGKVDVEVPAVGEMQRLLAALR